MGVVAPGDKKNLKKMLWVCFPFLSVAVTEITQNMVHDTKIMVVIVMVTIVVVMMIPVVIFNQ